MAKISARGATAVARYKKDNGATLVLCSDRRILVKYSTGSGYTIWNKLKADAAPGAMDRIAARMGYRKV